MNEPRTRHDVPPDDVPPDEGGPVRVRDHDPRAVTVAARLIDRVTAALPGTTVEHVGSTAVDGLAGTGVIDLLVPADPGTLDTVTAALTGLGFHHREHPGPLPPDRPLLAGVVDHDGARFRVHVHVVPADQPEAAEMRRFRDTLRADPVMRTAYAAHKRAIVANGATDPRAYHVAKAPWIRAELDRLARLAGPVAGADDLDDDLPDLPPVLPLVMPLVTPGDAPAAQANGSRMYSRKSTPW